jgi:hypothetical protein
VTLNEAVLEDRDLALDWAVPQRQDADDFSEQARLDAALEGGGQLSVRLLVSNLAKLDGRAELVTRLTLPDGRVFSDSVRRDRGEWEFGKDHLRATVGASTLEAKVGWARAHVVADGFALDVEVDSDERALRPSGGSLEFGGTYYRTTIDIPRGRLSGVLKVRGAQVPPPADEDAEKLAENAAEPGADDAAGDGAEPPEGEGPPTEDGATGEDDARPAGGEAALSQSDEDDETFVEALELEGAAYVEHRATDLAPYRMAKRWFKLKEITLERTLIISIFERTAELGGDLQGFVLIADDAALLAYEPALAVSPRTPYVDPETGYTLPTTLFVKGVGDSTFEGLIRPNALTERRDDLARMKKLERVIVKRFMKPFTFIFGESDYLFRRANPTAKEDARESWAGRGRFEIQQLNPD